MCSDSFVHQDINLKNETIYLKKDIQPEQESRFATP